MEHRKMLSTGWRTRSSTGMVPVSYGAAGSAGGTDGGRAGGGINRTEFCSCD
ncbi:hypothetical protein DY000_02055699 [Brassica cretica]|uniref:Uncharacterized protein n=1 Tax=Brassica cretica TaxID=69181 RepID=A0ABQ7AFK9_BRACR|nr:hypothetical protein DY000_02055699 [Brassica cretica]